MADANFIFPTDISFSLQPNQNTCTELDFKTDESLVQVINGGIDSVKSDGSIQTVAFTGDSLIVTGYLSMTEDVVNQAFPVTDLTFDANADITITAPTSLI